MTQLKAALKKKHTCQLTQLTLVKTCNQCM